MNYGIHPAELRYHPACPVRSSVRTQVHGAGDRLEVPLAAGLCDALIYNSSEPQREPNPPALPPPPYPLAHDLAAYDPLLDLTCCYKLVCAPSTVEVKDLPLRYLTLRELEIARCREENIPMKYNYSQVV